MDNGDLIWISLITGGIVVVVLFFAILYRYGTDGVGPAKSRWTIPRGNEPFNFTPVFPKPKPIIAKNPKVYIKQGSDWVEIVGVTKASLPETDIKEVEEVTKIYGSFGRALDL